MCYSYEHITGIIKSQNLCWTNKIPLLSDLCVSSLQFKLPFNILWFMAGSIQSYTHKWKMSQFLKSDFFLNPAIDGQQQSSLQASLQTGSLICLTGSLFCLPRLLTWLHCSARLLDCVNNCGLLLTLIERESVTPGHRVCNYPTGVQLHRRRGKIRRYKKKGRAVACGQQ